MAVSPLCYWIHSFLQLLFQMVYTDKQKIDCWKMMVGWIISVKCIVSSWTTFAFSHLSLFPSLRLKKYCCEISFRQPVYNHIFSPLSPPCSWKAVVHENRLTVPEGSWVVKLSITSACNITLPKDSLWSLQCLSPGLWSGNWVFSTDYSRGLSINVFQSDRHKRGLDCGQVNPPSPPCHVVCVNVTWAEAAVPN